VDNEPGSKAMLVEKLMPAARARLVTIADDAPLIEAAKLLRAGHRSCVRFRRVFGWRHHKD